MATKNNDLQKHHSYEKDLYDWGVNMTQYFLTALFALVGAFIGAYFTRQTQHHKWLLERRSEAFAKFLEMLTEARKTATDILRDTESKLSDHERSTRMIEAYVPALNYALIVKLYLSKSLRGEFYDCARGYSVLHTSPELTDKRLSTMSKKLDRIQEIFEQELSAYFWLLPSIRFFKKLS